MNRTFIPKPLIAAGLVVTAFAGSGLADDIASNPPGSGQEVSNFGQVPFYAVPSFTLSSENMQKLRDLEDLQLRERRALEDQFSQQMRELMTAQAAARDALVAGFAGTH